MRALNGLSRGANGGLTDGEAAIMDLWDRGVCDQEEIARATGYGVGYVETVVRRFDISERSLSSFDHMSKTGTASLLAAIKCFHPNYAELQ